VSFFVRCDRAEPLRRPEERSKVDAPGILDGCAHVDLTPLMRVADIIVIPETRCRGHR
jgi:hypothetical protein